MYQPGPTYGTHTFVIAIGLLIGFLGGWFINASEEYSMLCIVAAGCLVYVVKKGRDMHANDIIARSELAKLHQEDESVRGR